MPDNEDKNKDKDNNIWILDMDLLLYNVILTDFIQEKFDTEFILYLEKTWTKEAIDIYWNSYHSMKQALYQKSGKKK